MNQKSLWTRIKEVFVKPKTYDDILIDGIDTDGRPSDDNIPWFKLEGGPTADGRVRAATDWTPGLIEHLRTRYNYNGSSEDAIVQKFLAELAAQMANDGKEEINEFE